MNEDVDPWKTDLLSSTELSKLLYDSWEVLEIIGEMTSQNTDICPSSVCERFYQEEVKYLEEEKKNIYLNKKKSRISRTISDLKAMELVEEKSVSNKPDARFKYYALTIKGKDLLNDEKFKINLHSKIDSTKKTKSKNKPENEIDSFKRKYHSAGIRVLLKRIKTELEESIDINVSPSDIGYHICLNNLKKFPFEDDLLFDDLSYHLKNFITFEEFNKLLAKFKQLAIKYISTKSLFEDIITLELSKNISLPPSKGKNLINSFKPNLVLWVKDSFNLLMTNKKDLFNEYYVDFNVEVSDRKIEGTTVFEIKVNGEDMIILDNNGKINDIVSKLKEFMKILNETKAYDEYLEINDLRNQTYHALSEITRNIDKEILIPIYPGIDCPYLKS